MSCPICEKRKPGRFCPAKGERICAVCCGTEREVTLDCPADCAYLLSAHRYEEEHRKPFPPDTPFLDARFSADIIYSRQSELAGVAFAIAKFCTGQPDASDPDVLAALASLAEAYKTLATGIYYEKPPDRPAPRALYGELAKFLANLKQGEAERTGFSTLKDSEIFALLVFLYRMGLLRANGRPRSRKFIEYLRAQFPKSEDRVREEPRIIVP